MKLLYLNNELAVADGCNAHALGMLNAMKRKIGESNIYTYPQPEDCSAKHDSKRVLSFKDNFAGLLQYVRYYRKSIKSYRLAKQLLKDMQEKGFCPTHIWVRSSVFETTALYIAKATGAKLICEMNTPFYYEWCVTRQLPLRDKVEKWEKNLLHAADHIYVVSEKLKEMYMQHYALTEEKFIVVPNGYDRELYSDWKECYETIRNEIRKLENLEDKYVVTFIGSLKVWHGIDRFCEVARRMETNSKVHFMVLGDGEMRSLIQEYISKHSNMTFAGKLDYQTMKKYIYASDLGVMPYTKIENFYFSPLKMYDMIGGHLPFIGTNVGQISDVCANQLDDRFVVKDNSTDALVLAIRNIVDDCAVYEDMQKLIDEKVSEFTWDARAQLLIEKIGL